MTTQDDLQELQNLFLKLDTSSDGFLSMEELKTGMVKSIGLSAASTDWKELFEFMDTNGDGKIDYAEFTTAAIDRRIILNKKNLEASFAIIDQDGNGEISIQELR